MIENILIISVVICLVLLIVQFNQINKYREEKREIIKRIQNVLDGNQNEDQCYEETELSEISYMLRCLQTSVFLWLRKCIE